MALILKVEHTETSSDCATLTIEDTTGNYNASTNLGGYGAPNTARSSLYLKLFVTLKTSSGDEDISVDAYTEVSATSWDVDITRDGYYEIYLYACLAYNSGTTYAAGDIIYNSSDDTFYKSLLASNVGNAVTNATYWEEADTVSDFKAAIALIEADLSSNEAYEAIDDTVVLCLSKKCRAKLYADSCCGKCADKKFNEADYLIRAAQLSDEQGSYAEAQNIIESLQNICDCVDE